MTKYFKTFSFEKICSIRFVNQKFELLKVALVAPDFVVLNDTTLT